MNVDEILTRMNAECELDPIDALLAQVESQDPRARLVRAIWARRRSRLATEMESEAPRANSMQLSDPTQVGQAVSDLCAELAQLRELGVHLASALGACPTC